ncbi:DUF5047 domain-containing protein [Streptomyces sp. NPDC014623]|uniref:DUF5047 domain-containing protein n=1 Tax=Streptomyces sp. NPDC014623 TaxID=3364875 RepID=UPI0036FB8C5F
MYPVSARFLATLAQSHRPAFKVTLLRTDGSSASLAHTGGSVAVDWAQAISRTCTVTSADTSLIPSSEADELATYGARLRIERGIAYSDGTQELIPLGMFRLDTAGGDPLMGPVTLTGKSLEIVIQDDAFTVPYRASGTVVTAITALVHRSLPGAAISSRITDVAIGPRTWDVAADPWAAVQEIAAAAGARCYTDADGVFVIARLPDLLTTPPVWEVTAGEGGVYITGDRSMSSAGVHNGVRAAGENTEMNAAPVSYLATDNDPASPTYWNGAYGRRPTFYSSSTLTTVSACQAAAELQLAAGRAPNARGNFTSLPNPALEQCDVLRVVYPDGRRELHQVAAFTVPLTISGDFPISTISAKEDT